MKTQIVIEVDHHVAVNVGSKFHPIARAVLEQMYAVNDYSIWIEEHDS